MKYLVRKGEDSFGPFDVQKIAEGARAGEVTGATLVCREGERAWTPLADVPELAATIGLPVPRAPEPAWRVRWGAVAVAGILGAAAYASWNATHKDNLVRVECAPTNDSVTCSVEHTQGSETVSACWDILMTCESGGPVTGHACESVQPGQRSTVVLPASRLAGLDTCAHILSFNTTNLMLTQQ